MYGISRTVRAVDGVSFDLFQNEIYGVAGESSCGKTTLIKVISGNYQASTQVIREALTINFEGPMMLICCIFPKKSSGATCAGRKSLYVMQGSMSVLKPVRKVIKTFEDIV